MENASSFKNLKKSTTNPSYVNSVEVELNLKYFEVEFQRFIIKS